MWPPEESGFQLTPFNGPVRLSRKPREPTAPDYLEEHLWDQWSLQHQPRVGIGAYIHWIVILAGLLVHDELESARRRGPRTVCVGRGLAFYLHMLNSWMNVPVLFLGMLMLGRRY